MRERGLCDITFVVEEKEIKALRCILILNSKEFEKLLSDTTKNEFIITSQNVDYVGFSNMINYLSFQKIQLTNENIISTIKCSVEYKCATLSKYCEEYLEKNITLRMAIGLIESNLSDIYPIADKFLQANAYRIYSSNDLLILPSNTLLHCLKLENIIIPSEDALLKQIMKYIHEKEEEIHSNVTDILCQIQWNNINIENIKDFTKDEIIQKYCEKNFLNQLNSNNDKPIAFVKHNHIYYNPTNNDIIDNYYIKCLKSGTLIDSDEKDFLSLSLTPYVDFILQQSDMVILITVHVLFNRIYIIFIFYFLFML